jgi:undecaprenyl-phosphate galactose phosphotransferase
MASDIAALFVSFLFAYFFRSQVLPLVIHFKQSPLSFASQIKNGFLLGVPIVILIFGFEKLYTKRLAFWDEIRHLIKGIVISFLLIIIVVFLSRTYTYFSRLVIIISGFLSLWIFPLFRILMKKFLVKVKLWKKKILIIGTNKTAVLAAQGIRENPILGYDILGFVGEDSETLGQVMFGGTH